MMEEHKVNWRLKWEEQDGGREEDEMAPNRSTTSMG